MVLCIRIKAYKKYVHNVFIFSLIRVPGTVSNRLPYLCIETIANFVNIKFDVDALKTPYTYSFEIHFDPKYSKVPCTYTIYYSVHI